jgi:hypothetical protein
MQISFRNVGNHLQDLHDNPEDDDLIYVHQLVFVVATHSMGESHSSEPNSRLAT